MNTVQVKILNEKIGKSEDFPLPTRATDGSAGIDLRACIAEPLVLDNLIGEIRPASQRKDLLPVYTFNAEGLYLPGQTGKKSDTKKLSRWQDLLKKMRAEGFDIGEG